MKTLDQHWEEFISALDEHHVMTARQRDELHTVFLAGGAAMLVRVCDEVVEARSVRKKIEDEINAEMAKIPDDEETDEGAGHVDEDGSLH